jgi:flagellum-specific ATP synthase
VIAPTTNRDPETVVLERFEQFTRDLQRPGSLVRISGKLAAITGNGLTIRGLSRHSRIGDFLLVGPGSANLLAEVVSLTAESLLAKPLSKTTSIAIGMPVEVVGPLLSYPSNAWRGRVISALADPIDSLGPLAKGEKAMAYDSDPPASLERQAVDQPVRTGVKSIDILTPICLGQRIGIFAGSGVGKSTLMGMLARSPGFDTVIVALVGERGREVREFVTEILGHSIEKSVVIVATSDESASLRRLAPLLATATAEYFRDMGHKVLLVMDSVTRYAHALRELSMAAGESPVARGYPPSVFSSLPRLLERSGPGVGKNGSITGFYSVLVDGDNNNEPVSDAVRGTLDGHIVLSRKIASSGRYPAIDPLESISRLAPKSWTPQERAVANEMRRLISRYEETKDLRAIGSYTPGTDPDLDHAVQQVPAIYRALNQMPEDRPSDDAFRDMPKPPLPNHAAKLQQG